MYKLLYSFQNVCTYIKSSSDLHSMLIILSNPVRQLILSEIVFKRTCCYFINVGPKFWCSIMFWLLCVLSTR